MRDEMCDRQAVYCVESTCGRKNMDYNKCCIDKEFNVEDTLEHEGLNMLLTLCLKSRMHVSIKV